jgi:hypothetical protein
MMQTNLAVADTIKSLVSKMEDGPSPSTAAAAGLTNSSSSTSMFSGRSSTDSTQCMYLIFGNDLVIVLNFAVFVVFPF